jgi:hypothetical protein
MTDAKAPCGLFVAMESFKRKLVRILHPLSAWIGAEPAHAKPQCFGDSRDSKNDSIWGARREIQRRTTPCTELHGRYRRPKELRRIAKNPRKTRVLQRRGQEPNLLRFFLYFLQPDGKTILPTTLPTLTQTSHCGSRSGS